MRETGVPRLVLSSTAAVYRATGEAADRGNGSDGTDQPLRRNEARFRARAALVRGRLRARFRQPAVIQRRRGDREKRRAPQPGDTPAPGWCLTAPATTELASSHGQVPVYPTADRDCVHNFLPYRRSGPRARPRPRGYRERGNVPRVEPGVQRRRLLRPPGHRYRGTRYRVLGSHRNRRSPVRQSSRAGRQLNAIRRDLGWQPQHQQLDTIDFLRLGLDARSRPSVVDADAADE